MNGLYQTILLEKLLQYPCYIKYRSSIYTFERPFKFADLRTPLEIIDSSYVTVVDCLTGNTVNMQFNDVVMFHVDHEGDQQKANDELQKVIDGYKATFSQFKYLRGRRLHDLFFRADHEERKQVRLKNLRILDAIQLDDLDDYDRLLKNDPEVVNRLKEHWKSLILQKYTDTVKSIDDEIADTNDESITSELNTIKEILASVKTETDEELAPKKTCEDVMIYWPTLLLPRSQVFDIT